MDEPARSSFPPTRLSVVRAAGSADPEARAVAFETLVGAYWKPVYKYLRVRWRATDADAEDLTQGFFARALEKAWFAGYDPRRARFRTFLRACLDGFVSNERQAATRLKRGGGVAPLSLDFAAAEGELAALAPHSADDPETFFHREWARSFFASAVEALRAACTAGGREAAFRLFERYDLEGPAATARPTYALLAAEAGLSVSQVTNALFAVRRQFRRLVLERLRDLTGSEEEFRAEARALLGEGEW
jgi:DNA-directed RNA polymerase specialized sigma24 family protein